MSDISDIAKPDAEIVENEHGGKQSHIPVRFDLIDGKALFEQAKVLHEGAVRYGENNWRKIPVEDHLNHLIMHAYAYLAGDRTDEHLSHIMCRATFAQAVAIDGVQEGDIICGSPNCGYSAEGMIDNIKETYADKPRHSCCGNPTIFGHRTNCQNKLC